VTTLSDVFTKSASKPTVLCDVDNTLAWTMNQSLAMLNGMFGTNYVLADVNVYHFLANLPLTQSNWMKQQFKRSTTYVNIAPDFHAIDAINELAARDYKIVIATSRAADMQSVTEAWLSEWGVKSDEVLVGPTAKQEFVQANSNVVAIDDDPSTALNLASAGANVLIPDRTYTPLWCKSSRMQNVRVFYTWDDVLNQLS
jgi:uncharacterized HAD superfamily protein